VAGKPWDPEAIDQTIGEEIANSIIHGLGAALGVAGLVVMVVMSAIHGTAIHVVATSIFGASLVLLYLTSTLYHGITNRRAKRVFQILDHGAIYVLIAGTYTPFTLVSLGGGWGWSIFGVVWGLAVAGVVAQSVFPGRYRALMTGLYLAMGWIVVIAIVPLYNSMDRAGLFWLVAGGVTYSLGVVFYARRWFPFSHAIWHLFVLGGSLCHVIAVMFHVIPRIP
jgi:hemolysin III